MSVIWKDILAQELQRLDERKWSEGEIFATTQSLATAHGVSAITARRVLIELVKTGRVKNVPRLGCVIAEQKKQPLIYLLSPDNTLWDNPPVMMPLLLKGCFEEALRQNLELQLISGEKAVSLPSDVPAFLIYVYQLNILNSNVLVELLPNNILPCGIHCPIAPTRGIAIGADAEEIMALQVETLLKAGCKKIGYVGPSNDIWFSGRLAGFMKSMRERHQVVEFTNILSCDQVDENSFRRWMKNFAPDGICTPAIQIADQIGELLSAPERKKVKIGSIGLPNQDDPGYFYIQPDYYAEGRDIIQWIAQIDPADIGKFNGKNQYHLVSGKIINPKEN